MFNKALFQIALGAVACGTAFGEDVDLPNVANARVTLPYSELKELWKAAQQNNRPPPAKPPVAAELSSARYEIEVRENRVVGSVEFEAQSFSEEWTALPLLGAGAPVHKIEPADASIILRDGNYTWLTNKPAKQRIRMFFAAALVQEGDGARLQLPNSLALVSTVTVKGVPPGKSLRVPHALEISSDKAVSSFQIAPQSPIELQLLPTTTTAPVPSQWQISALCFATFADDALRYEAQVAAVATGGSALSLNLTLPRAARVVSVNGDDLSSWRADDSGKEVRVVALQWRTPGVFNRKIDIVYELPQRLDNEWQLFAPQAADGKISPPTFAVAGGSEIELAAAEQIPSPQAPRWLSGKLSGIPNVIVTRQDKITAKLLPVVEVAPAIVECAQFHTRIVADGSSIDEQTYVIRARSSMVWPIELPDKSELLSCAVNDRRTNPVNRGNGILEIPIAAETEGRPVRISLSYTSRNSPFQPVSGRLRVELPKTPLLINSLTWDLAIPADYEVAAFEGNLTPIGGAPEREGSTVVRLKKELCRNERPGIELFYQKPEVKK
jgi:hypothetical protein